MAEISPSTLRTHVAKRLRKDILAGKYRPGDRLNESLIAREFNMSRIPVREALFELRDSGLVMNRERRGMFVTALSPDEVEKISAVRVILEAEALALARIRMTPKVAAALQNLVDKMESSTVSLAEAAALDLEFHRAIWAAAGNEYLQRVLDPLATLLFAHNLLERVSVTHHKWRINHHRVLLDVMLRPIADGDIKGVFMRHLQASSAPEAEDSVAAPALPQGRGARVSGANGAGAKTKATAATGNATADRKKRTTRKVA
jgi:DNA-binding GntR family transcriptional regulator